MKNKHSDILKEYIVALEKKQILELEEVKHQLHEIHESLNPVTIVLNSIKELKDTPNLTGDVLRALVAVLGGFLSRKFIVQDKVTVWSRLKGTLVQSIASYFISKKLEE